MLRYLDKDNNKTLKVAMPLCLVRDMTLLSYSDKNTFNFKPL